jgi:hypothetical protein
MTIEIGERAHRLLEEIAAQQGASTSHILEVAIETYRRKCFLDGLASDFRALRDDPEAWREELEERRLWETTLLDGLQKDE